MQGSNASWPVGGATRQSGGNWVGRFEKPEDWNIWASMYSSNLELGQLITVGDAILKWTASGVKFVDAVFATQADFDSFCSKIGTPIAPGSTASANGVQYAYVDGGWAAAVGLTPYADYTTLSARAPTVGKIAQIPRLCGNGYFALRGNGIRWEVCPGESIVRDAGVGSAGYDLTATGTTYVPLVSYTIPAGLIGDGEEWEFDIHAMSLDVHAPGNDYVESFVGSTKFLGSGPTLLSGVNQVTRKRGAFVRLNGVLAMRAGTATADLYSVAPNNDATVDMSIPQVLTAGFVPGAATNKMRLRHVCFRRIG